MKTYIERILLITLLGLGLTSCEVSDNGDLDGYWYLTQVDSLETNVSADMHNASITWSFQMDLMQVYQAHSNDSTIMLRFDNNNNQTLTLTDPFIYNRMEGDQPITTERLYLLNKFGISDIPEIYIIEQLNSKKLRISNDKLRLYFEKR